MLFESNKVYQNSTKCQSVAPASLISESWYFWLNSKDLFSRKDQRTERSDLAHLIFVILIIERLLKYYYERALLLVNH